MVLSRTVAALAPLALIVLPACGGSDGDDAGSRDDGSVPAIVATTSIWGDVVSNVACDGLADVRVLVPPGADPHSFEPSLQDREVIDGAALVVANGAALEASLVDVLDTVEADGVPVFEMTSALELLDGGEHGGVDPHVWQDPARVAAALPALRDAVVAAGFDAAAVDACVDDYRAELEQLDDDVEATLATIPAERRILVTNHDSLAYFADRYGFEILGTVIPAPTTLAETNPADLEELAALIAETGVPAIFTEEQHAAADAEALAERVGDVAVVQLFTDSLGPEGSGAETYSGLVRTNARAIADALAP